MTQAGVGDRKDRGGEVVEVVLEDSGIGLMADKSASRVKEDVGETTRVRPSKLIV